MSKKTEIKRALISVSDKTGVVDFASKLANLGIDILSTGGTYKLFCLLYTSPSPRDRG